MIELYDHQKVALEYLRLYEAVRLVSRAGLRENSGRSHPYRKISTRWGEIESALVIAPKASDGAAWTRDIAKFPSTGTNGTEANPYSHKLRIGMRERAKATTGVWTGIILDESHKIKNRTAKQTSFYFEVALLKQNIAYILTVHLSETGRLEDLWSQYAFFVSQTCTG